LYEKTASQLKEKMSSTQELIQSLQEDIEEWRQEFDTVTAQLQKYQVQLPK